MKKLLGTLVLLVFVSVGFAGIDGIAHTSSTNAKCFDSKGNAINSKECSQTNCTCLFHQVVDFVEGMF